MTKDNILFAIIGVLLGFIVGFMFANTANQRAAAPIAQNAQNLAGLPPDHPDINQGGGDSAASMAAIQEAVKLANDQPKSLEAQLKAAEVYSQIRRFDEAIKYLMKANEIDPANYEVIVGLGNANFDSDQFEQAEKWYMAALAKKSDDLSVRTDMAITFIYRRPPNFQRAVAELRQVLGRDPNHPQALHNLVIAYTNLRDVTAANATFERLKALNPANPALERLKGDIDKVGSESGGQSNAGKTKS